MVGLPYHSDHRFCPVLTMHITAPALWESGAVCFASGMALWWQGLIREVYRRSDIFLPVLLYLCILLIYVDQYEKGELVFSVL